MVLLIDYAVEPIRLGNQNQRKKLAKKKRVRIADSQTI